MRIPVVMTMDDNYVSQIKVVIYSMRKHTLDEIFLNVTVLCDRKLSDIVKKEMVSFAETMKNITIDFVEINETALLCAKSVGHVHVCSYYRLLIGDVIDDDKCIYLDGDIVVLCDLSELYNIDVQDCYMAGVRDIGFVMDPDWKMYHMKKYRFSTMNDYINAGVLVLNLKKMRDENIRTLFIDEVKNDYYYMDQDIINKVCYGKIQIIDPAYNCFHKYSEKCNYSWKSDLKTKIIHYAGPYKPWDNLKVRYANIWWQIANRALEKEEYERHVQKAKTFTRQLDWSYIADRIIGEQMVVIVGYSLIGMQVYSAIRKNNYGGDIVFCDNSKCNQEIGNGIVKVVSVDRATEDYKEALWINTSQKFRKELNEQIEKKGINTDRIIQYYEKNQGYFEYLDEKYLKNEYVERIFMQKGTYSE